MHGGASRSEAEELTQQRGSGPGGELPHAPSEFSGEEDEDVRPKQREHEVTGLRLRESWAQRVLASQEGDQNRVALPAELLVELVGR